jgi:hypothetical protein
MHQDWTFAPFNNSVDWYSNVFVLRCQINKLCFVEMSSKFPLDVGQVMHFHFWSQRNHRDLVYSMLQLEKRTKLSLLHNNESLKMAHMCHVSHWKKVLNHVREVLQAEVIHMSKFYFNTNIGGGIAQLVVPLLIVPRVGCSNPSEGM